MRLGCSAVLLTFAGVLHAQELFAPTDSLGAYGRVVQSWIALRVSPGREASAMERIRGLSDEWSTGALGSLVRTRGEGSPHRVIACGLDKPTYVVSHITDDGYLRVHVAAGGPMSDQTHMGQRIIVLTTDRANTTRVRAVPGVFGVRSTHLWRSPQGSDAPITREDLWIDVGARTRVEVAGLGIRLLDPVFRDLPDWSVGDAVVGPWAADRAGCAAVAAAAERSPTRGRSTFVIAAQSSLNWTGLNAVLASLGDVDSIFVAGTEAPRFAKAISARTRFPGTLVETIREADLRTLFEEVTRAAAVPAANRPSGVRLSSAYLRPPQPTDSFSRYAELLTRLTDTYVVSGDEGPMRDVLRARLPVWARDLAETDTAGNLILAMGPDKDTVVFIAHMDEVGFEVTRADGETLTLRQRGGFYPWLYTGQPALLHLLSPTSDRAQGCRASSGSALRGVFLPTDTSAPPANREVRAWFGSQLGSVRGVTGLKVTGFKCATRLATMRFTARSIDDRLGSGALLLALDGIETSKLAHKVIFIWSVREETGLGGARAAAAELGPNVRRVHAVDTFVSADSPLETGRFAVVPIGTGAVVRGLDNASVVAPDEIERVVRIARASGIPLQIGTTNGGTDGSAFAAFGASYVGISWPLRYSHSPVEVIDLRDMRSLARLVTALAVAPVR
jgi:putative aminopeptidase FrvX